MKNKARYDNHPLWDNVRGILASEDLRNLPSETRDYLLYLLHDLDKRRDSTNPFYVQERSLDDLNSRLSNVASWMSNPNNASSIDQYVDACFSTLSSEWPANNGRRIADISKTTYDNYIEDATRKIDLARKAADDVDQLKANCEVEIETLRRLVAEMEASARDSLAQLEESSSEKSVSIVDEFNAAVLEVEKNAKESAAQIESDYVTTLKTLNEEAEGLLEKVRTRSSSISGWVIADTYGKYARNKTIATVLYDCLAVFFALAGIAVVAFALALLSVDGTNATVFKLAVSAASFTISGFLFKRGTFNQRESKAAKRTELTLRQYEPFIANLSEEESRNITKQIAERIFIRGEIGDKDEKTVSNALLDRGLTDKQITTIAELVKAFSKN